MGYEGLDGSRDVANETKKHPWEVFPEDDSASKGGKNKAQREKEKARHDKRKAKLDTIKTWINKNKILTAGIILAIIALIVGIVILVINLVNPKNGEQYNNTVESIEVRIPDNFVVEETATPDYAYGIIYEQLKQATSDVIFPSDGDFDDEKFEDIVNAYIRDNVKNDADKPAYELGKIILLLANDKPNRARYLLDQFKEQNYELGKNTRYIYIMAELVYSMSVENTDEETKWRETLDKEYPVEESYIDIDTYEAITDKEQVQKIKEDLEKMKTESDNSVKTEEE